MKLKKRFEEIKAALLGIEEAFVVIVSLATDDGGKAGVLSQVTRELAAKMIVDKKCMLASAEQHEEFHRKDREAHEKQKKELLESRVRRELDFETLVGIRNLRDKQDSER